MEGRLLAVAGILLPFSQPLRAATVFYADGEDNAAALSTTVADPLALDIPSGSATQSGIVGGNGSLTKTGSGSLALSGDNSESNTYTGATVVQAGELVARKDTALGSKSAVTVNGGAKLVIFGDYDLGAFYVKAGSLAGGGDVEIGSFARLTVGGNNLSTTFSGSITSTGDYGDLYKRGTGTLTLTGTSTIGGYLDIGSGGALEIDGGDVTAPDFTFASGTLSIVGGGQLHGASNYGAFIYVDGALEVAGSGSLAEGREIYTDGGTVAVGGGGTLDVPAVGIHGGGTFILGDGAILDFRLGTGSGQILVDGDSFLFGPEEGLVTLNIFDSGGFGEGTYTLFDFTGGTAENFDLGDFQLGTTVAGYDYALGFSGATLNLAVTAVPEPSAWLMLLGGAAGLAVASLLSRNRPAAESPQSR